MQRLHFSPALTSSQFVSVATLKVRQCVRVRLLEQIGLKGLGVTGTIDFDPALGGPVSLLPQYLRSSIRHSVA